MWNPLRIAKYGLGTLSVAAIVLGGAGFGLYLLAPWAAALPAALFAFVLYFFRDPRRVIPGDAELVVSPADGRVADIGEVDEPLFIGGKALRIGIFLSVFNVHVNRAPLAGTVRKVAYKPGKFLAAFNHNASTQNEANFVGIEAERALADGRPLRLAVRQISGLIARRIVCACGEGSRLDRGERFGMIKFGSRTELLIPPEAAGEVMVKVGDKVRGGASVLLRLSSAVAGNGADGNENA